jgi:hypothetical protein
MPVVLGWTPAVSLRSTAGLSHCSHASGMTEGSMLDRDSANLRSGFKRQDIRIFHWFSALA